MDFIAKNLAKVSKDTNPEVHENYAKTKVNFLNNLIGTLIYLPFILTIEQLNDLNTVCSPYTFAISPDLSMQNTVAHPLVKAFEILSTYLSSHYAKTATEIGMNLQENRSSSDHFCTALDSRDTSRVNSRVHNERTASAMLKNACINGAQNCYRKSEKLLMKHVYDISTKDFAKIMYNKGAKIAKVYMILPYQLTTRKNFAMPFYNLFFVFNKNLVSMFFDKERSLGYNHDYNCWASWLSTNVINYNGSSYVFEVKRTIGLLSEIHVTLTTKPGNYETFISYNSPKEVPIIPEYEYDTIYNLLKNNSNPTDLELIGLLKKIDLFFVDIDFYNKVINYAVAREDVTFKRSTLANYVSSIATPITVSGSTVIAGQKDTHPKDSMISAFILECALRRTAQTKATGYHFSNFKTQLQPFTAIRNAKLRVLTIILNIILISVIIFYKSDAIFQFYEDCTTVMYDKYLEVITSELNNIQEIELKYKNRVLFYEWINAILSFYKNYFSLIGSSVKLMPVDDTMFTIFLFAILAVYRVLYRKDYKYLGFYILTQIILNMPNDIYFDFYLFKLLTLLCCCFHHPMAALTLSLAMLQQGPTVTLEHCENASQYISFLTNFYDEQCIELTTEAITQAQLRLVEFEFAMTQFKLAIIQYILINFLTFVLIIISNRRIKTVTLLLLSPIILIDYYVMAGVLALNIILYKEAVFDNLYELYRRLMLTILRIRIRDTYLYLSNMESSMLRLLNIKNNGFGHFIKGKATANKNINISKQKINNPAPDGNCYNTFYNRFFETNTGNQLEQKHHNAYFKEIIAEEYNLDHMQGKYNDCECEHKPYDPISITVPQYLAHARLQGQGKYHYRNLQDVAIELKLKGTVCFYPVGYVPSSNSYKNYGFMYTANDYDNSNYLNVSCKLCVKKIAIANLSGCDILQKTFIDNEVPFLTDNPLHAINLSSKTTWQEFDSDLYFIKYSCIENKRPKTDDNDKVELQNFFCNLCSKEGQYTATRSIIQDLYQKQCMGLPVKCTTCVNTITIEAAETSNFSENAWASAKDIIIPKEPNYLKMQEIFSVFEFLPTSLLEIGAAPGNFTAYFATFIRRIMAISSPSGLLYAKQTFEERTIDPESHPNVDAVYLDVADFKSDEKFEMIVSDAAIERDSEQEVKHNELLQQIIKVINGNLAYKGSAVIKIFTVIEEPTKKLVKEIGIMFNKSSLYKPQRSRAHNEEQYLILSDYKYNSPVADPLAIDEISKMAGKVQNMVDDIFEKHENQILLQCISSDVKMSAGFAAITRDTYPELPGIIPKNLPVGSAIVIKHKQKLFGFLITKKNYFDKPTYETLDQSLTDLARRTEKRSVIMPKIASGIDKLEWDNVLKMISQKLVDFEVTVYTIDTRKEKQFAIPKFQIDGPCIACNVQQYITNEQPELIENMNTISATESQVRICAQDYKNMLTSENDKIYKAHLQTIDRILNFELVSKQLINVVGLAGSGKTTMLIKKYGKALFVVPTVELKKEYIMKSMAAITFSQFIKHENLKAFDTIVFDEVYQQHPYNILFALYLRKKVVIAGDPRQNVLGSTEYKPSITLQQLINGMVKPMAISHTVLPQICQYLALIGYNIKTLNNRIGAISEHIGEPPKHEKCIVFTRKEANNPNYITSQSVQGKRIENINIFISANAEILLDNMPQVYLVALTRATKNIAMYYENSRIKQKYSPIAKHNCTSVNIKNSVVDLDHFVGISEKDAQYRISQLLAAYNNGERFNAFPMNNIQQKVYDVVNAVVPLKNTKSGGYKILQNDLVETNYQNFRFVPLPLKESCKRQGLNTWLNLQQ